MIEISKKNCGIPMILEISLLAGAHKTMENEKKWGKTKYLFLIGIILSTLALASCSSDPTTTTQGTGTGSITKGKGCTQIGILMPEKTSAPRWATKDGPMLQQAIQKAIPNAQIDNDNANGDSDLQYQQAQNDLNKGDCILVVAANDSVAAADIVSMARDRGVPVIAYDRLIQSKDTSYYVSFDGVAVGKLQGEYIVQHYTHYAAQNGTVNMVMVNGSQTDTNALLFSQGVHEVLDPLFQNSTFQLKAEVYTPAWNTKSAKVEMETMLTQNSNNIQVAYVANDNMAAQVINALQSQNINGTVLVTGQDATTAGIHNILSGDQGMTVYKPTALEAQSTADLVKAISNGTDTHTLTNGHTVYTNDGGNVPAVLDQPIAVDRTNIASTVLKDNFVTKAAICKGLAPGTDGIC